MGWSLEEAEQTFKAMDRDGDGGVSANEYAAFCQMEDKNLQFGTLNGIAKLRQQLADLQAQLAAMAGKDTVMEDLKKRLAAAEKQLAEEQKVWVLAARVQPWEGL
jgi:Ca2+-binding EF-hand superfamily protein